MTAHLLPAERLPELASMLRDAPLVAVDTEFHAENRYHPHLCLVQVHVPGRGVYLLDPLDPRSLPAVAEALRATTWLLHAGRQDLRVLAPALGGVPDVVVDTQIAAGLVGPVYPVGYGDLAHDLVGVSLEKSATLSDWSRRPLGEEQLRYAGDDVLHLPRIWEELARRLAAADRTHLAQQAFAEARDEALAAPDPGEAWREIPQAVHLDEAGRAALRSLAAWRERAGVDTDHPPRSLVSDALLADLARRRPTSINRILSNRRFPRRVVERHGAELLACLHDDRSPPGDLGVIAPQSPEDRAVQFLRLGLGAAGAAQGWSQRLVAPDAILERLVLHPEAPAAWSPWRAALLGTLPDDLRRGQTRLALIDGRVALTPDRDDHAC